MNKPGNEFKIHRASERRGVVASKGGVVASNEVSGLIMSPLRFTLTLNLLLDRCAPHTSDL